MPRAAMLPGDNRSTLTITRRGLLGGAAATGVLAGLGASLALPAATARARHEGAVAIFTTTVVNPTGRPARAC
jgi:hypothetical protein